LRAFSMPSFVRQGESPATSPLPCVFCFLGTSAF
jgi:hypothetical protein